MRLLSLSGHGRRGLAMIGLMTSNPAYATSDYLILSQALRDANSLYDDDEPGPTHEDDIGSERWSEFTTLCGTMARIYNSRPDSEQKNYQRWVQKDIRRVCPTKP
jgi:hypothetical protein